MTIESINFLEIENELKERFKNRYRKIYIQYSRLNSICITCFLNQNKGYRIFTIMKMNIRDVNSDYFYSFILKNE